MLGKQNTREIGAAHELEALHALVLVGWLTTAQLGAWVWPQLVHSDAQNRAHKVMARLVTDGDVMKRKTSLCANAFVLTRPGARRCVDAGLSENIRPGYNLSQLDALRQALPVEWLLAQRQLGRLAFGGAAIRAGTAHGWMLPEGLGITEFGQPDASGKRRTVAGADALSYDESSGIWRAAIVVRTEAPKLIARARRLRRVAGELVFLGSPATIARFKKELG